MAFKAGVAPRMSRAALTVQAKFSRIGKQPITVPSNVTVKLDGLAVHVKVLPTHTPLAPTGWKTAP